jgi:hypothetical protein
MPLSSVAEEHDPSPARFVQLYRGKTPVVLRGLVARWPAVERWTSAYLERKLGDSTIRVKRGDVVARDYERMTFGEFLVRLNGEHPLEHYFHNFPLLQKFPDLRADVDPFPSEWFPRWYSEDWWMHSQFFMGPSTTRTPLHFDSHGTHGWIFQLQGRKRVIFVSAEDARRCPTTDFFWSRIDVDDPRFEELTGGAQRTECTLEAGDALYWPPWTMHHVVNPELSMSLSLEWHTLPSAVTSLFTTVRHSRWKETRFNIAHAVGLATGLPIPVLFRVYGQYFDSPRKRGDDSAFA